MGTNEYGSTGDSATTVRERDGGDTRSENEQSATMSSFCPVCESMLALKMNTEVLGASAMMLTCRTCAYRTTVQKTVSERESQNKTKHILFVYFFCFVLF